MVRKKSSEKAKTERHVIGLGYEPGVDNVFCRPCQIAQTNRPLRLEGV
jgi:hypothetical protein